MDPREQFERLSDYGFEVNRSKLRFCGIGPKIAGQNECRLWPRDYIQSQNECNKILRPDLRQLIGNEQRIERIDSVISDLFNSLKCCRIDGLFNKFCPLERDFLHSEFSLKNRLNAHTEYCKIYLLIHNLLRSIRIGSHRGDSLVHLFGSNKNLNIYKQHLKILVNGNAKLKRIMIGRFVHFGLTSMDIGQVDWLEGLSQRAKGSVFIQVILAITNFVAEMLRRYFYITISNPFADKIFYFRYDLWQRMRDTVYREFELKGLLQPMLIDQESAHKVNSKTRFLLKRDDIRLICTNQGVTKPTEEDYQLRAALIFVLKRMPYNENFNLVDFLKDLRRIQAISIESEPVKPVYIVRADMEDCFHSINQEKLISIIGKLLHTQFPDGYVRVKKFRCALKKPRRSQREIPRWTCSEDLLERKGSYIFTELVAEKRIELERFLRDYVQPQILRPVLRVSKTSTKGFRLMSGIRQGSKNSPLFCSIYIHQALTDHMGNILADQEGKLFRYVDDLLYMTTNLAKAQEFVATMLGGFEGFGLKSNASKLACNFPCTDKPEVRRLANDVIFFKRRISIKTMGCSHVFSYNSVSIDNTFYVNPYTTQEELARYVTRWTQVELVHLDFKLNGLELVVENIFQHAMMIAYRLATVIIISFMFKDLQNQQPLFISNIARQVAKRLFKILNHARASDRIINDLDYHEVRLIVVAAFLTTWSSNKLRHRKRERDKLEARYNRFKMKYLISSNTKSGLILEDKLHYLIQNSTKSSAWKEVRLPDK